MKPSVVMIAGANGAGKTSAAMTLLPNFMHVREFVNADEIARGLSPLNPASMAIEAGRLVLKRIHTLVEHRKHFAFETTRAGHGHIRTLERCRQAGYDISLLFLYLSSVDLAVRRVKLRVAQGGHDVPQSDIIRRYRKGLKMFFNHYVPLADKVEVYNNSDGDAVLIADCVSNGIWKLQQPQIWQKIQDKANEE